MNLITKLFFLAFLALVNADDCKCRLKSENKIVGGEMSQAHFIPWMAYISHEDVPLCGGSIMNEKYILTAASCVKDKNRKDLRAWVGTHKIRGDSQQSKIHKIKTVYLYENEGTPDSGDIAILELSKKIKFQDGLVEKGCFNLKEKEYPEQFLVAGWGFTKVLENAMYLDFNFVPDSIKHTFYKQSSKCKDFLICISPVNEADSICVGDTGGPLQYTENGMTSVEGVLSSVKSEPNGKTIRTCLGDGEATRLSYYADWISEIADFDFCGSGPKTEPKYKQPKKKRFGIF